MMNVRMTSPSRHTRFPGPDGARRPGKPTTDDVSSRRLRVGRSGLGRFEHADRSRGRAGMSTADPDRRGQAVSRYTRAAVSWKSLAFSAVEYFAVSRLNEFHSTV